MLRSTVLIVPRFLDNEGPLLGIDAAQKLAEIRGACKAEITIVPFLSGCSSHKLSIS
jgi:hypothetical protein